MTSPDEHEDNGPQNRGSKRDSLFLLATARLEGGDSVGRLRIRNLSETGLMADCETPLAKDDKVIVDLRGVGEVSGTIRWFADGRIGMEFDQRINPQGARKPVSKGGEDVPSYLRPIVSGRPGFRR